jgi:hypothetical protein
MSAWELESVRITRDDSTVTEATSAAVIARQRKFRRTDSLFDEARARECSLEVRRLQTQGP